VRVGIDAEGHADERLRHAGGRRQRRLVGRIEHDGRADRRGVQEKRLVLVVPVDHELVALEPGGPREGELARGGDVGSDPLFA
jgi:hypothetical protein